MTIEETWRLLAERCGDRGVSPGVIATMKEAYVAGVYAASAAVISEDAKSRDLSEAAHRIEQRR